MKPIAFTGKCQRKTIQEQYEKYNVRSFDLRVRFTDTGSPIVAHGIFEYDISPSTLMGQLAFLDRHGDCYVRVLHEVRNKKQYTTQERYNFRQFCCLIETQFTKIKFYHGKNLYNWTCDYSFENHPTEDEKYSSVTKPRLIDDWWPWLYAKLHNKKIVRQGTDKDILSIDYVDIQ